jgi:hypothetical protein
MEYQRHRIKAQLYSIRCIIMHHKSWLGINRILSINQWLVNVLILNSIKLPGAKVGDTLHNWKEIIIDIQLLSQRKTKVPYRKHFQRVESTLLD